MRHLKIGLIIIIFIALIFTGYELYNYYEQWKEPKIDTIKTVVEVDPNKTYGGLKEKVLELKEDEEVNKVEIKELRIDLSKERKAFLASNDTILIKTTSEDTLLLYRDEDGVLQSASDNIEKIIEHRDIVVLPEELSISDKDWDIKIGGYYNLTDNEYGLAFSKEVIGIKDYSLNISVLTDMEDFDLGANLNYEVKESLQLGIGVTINKDYYVVLEYEF